MGINRSDNNYTGGKWLLLAAVFAVGLVCFILPQLVFYPWRTVPNLLGDGGKNTFTYLYHILYDRGLWFTGMNYPYGEHIVYTDGQPLLSVPLGYLHASMGQAFALMGWLTALSYVLAVLFLFQILSSFGVRPLIAMIGSGLVAVFTPQITGIPGHYALSYSCFIPMLFYWTIQYSCDWKWKYPAFILVASLIFSFLHPYYSALAFVWAGAYIMGHFIFSKSSFKQKCAHTLPLLVPPVVTFSVLGLFMKLTDPVKDRPVTPFSSGDNYTSLTKILTSPFSPVSAFLKEHGFITNVSGNADGCSYVGLAVACILAIALIIALADRFRRKAGTTPPTVAPVWLFVAFGTLVFSMGIPFIWHLEWLLDYLPFFKQFRTLARFSWIFYYIITVYAIVLLNNWYGQLREKGKRVPAFSILVLPFLLWAYEANAITGLIRQLLYNGGDNYYILAGKREVFWKKYLAEHKHDASDFQAILMLKFFQVGSEKLWLDGDIYGFTIGSVAAMQLHLPLVDAMMSRTSWSVAEKQVKLIAGPYVPKPSLSELKSDKPFLLIKMGPDTTDADQQYLLQASDYIGSYVDCSVYACYPARIRNNDQQHAAAIDSLLPSLKPGDTCIGGSGTWFTEHFDNHITQGSFFGPGALPQQQQLRELIADIPLTPTDAGHIYEFSCWALVGNEDYRTPDYLLNFLDSAGNTIDRQYAITKNSTDNHRLWFRASLYFTMPAGCRKINCLVEKTAVPTYIQLDELMLRPVGTIIISRGAGGRTMVNNHLFYPKPY